jgi:hypothetical protein
MKEQVSITKITAEKTEWFNEKGQRHRLDGPAAQWADGSKSWHIIGKPLSETRFLAKTR